MQCRNTHGPVRPGQRLSLTGGPPPVKLVANRPAVSPMSVRSAGRGSGHCHGAIRWASSCEAHSPASHVAVRPWPPARKPTCTGPADASISVWSAMGHVDIEPVFVTCQSCCLEMRRHVISNTNISFGLLQPMISSSSSSSFLKIITSQ